MSSSTGKMFVVTTFGESHGPALGAVVDGCPAGIRIGCGDIQRQLDRRRPGQGRLTTSRKEGDRVELLSGLEDGVSLGTPICLLIRNSGQKKADYAAFSDIPRPSHADFTYRMKYGIVASSGGGRASGRETAARVAAGGVAEKFLADRHGVGIVAWVSAVGGIEAPAGLEGEKISRSDVDGTEVRCPDRKAARGMTDLVLRARADGDSVGGIITCVCSGVPAGWGEPVFDKLEAMLGAAMMSIPAVKGFEIGSGFAAARMRGSEHNDLFVRKHGRLGTATNRSGGVQGGISNGEPVVFRVAFKPTATIAAVQATADYRGRIRKLEGRGRHDPCIVPRAVPVVEAMAAMVLADAALMAGTALR